jgi:hypothetical protein
MKKVICFGLVLLLTLGLLGTAAAEPNRLDLKVGDTIFACNCGEECPCNTMAKKPGKCVCGHEMVEAKVTKVEEGKAYLQAKDWPKARPFLTMGKYYCACGPDCTCNTISQKPGKCVCGTEMKSVQ